MHLVTDPRMRRPLDHDCRESAVRIVYGLPGPDVVDAADRGEVVLGGCMPDGFAWQCRSCGRRGPGGADGILF